MKSPENTRHIRNQPFCWQEKAILRLLRKKYKGNELIKMKLLYCTLTEIENDFNGKPIEYYTKTIATYSGLSKDWIPKGLRKLENLHIIKINEHREKGIFRGRRLTFTPQSIETTGDPTNTRKPVSGFSDTSEESILNTDFRTVLTVIKI